MRNNYTHLSALLGVNKRYWVGWLCILLMGSNQAYSVNNLKVLNKFAAYEKAATNTTSTFTFENQLPKANAGSDKIISLPTNKVTLNGSATDADGTISSYAWKQVSGPNTATFSSKAVAAPTVSGLVAGSYVFSLTVKDNQLASSAADKVTVTVKQKVVSFTLINADTDQPIQTLTNGATLNLATLPTKNLNIRANTAPATVGSVVFALTGAESRNQTETSKPYALFGGDTDYLAWVPVGGSYSLKATPYTAAKGTGTAGTAAAISFTITNQSQVFKVNFQDPATVPTAGWVRDYGQPFGLRTGQYQGSNLTYGWKKRSDGSLLDLSVGGTTPGNGRDRGIPADVLKATLMHMQGNTITGTFNGTKVEGYWEMKVPKGIYDVTVSAGDGAVHTAPESHTLNVEGAKAISNFVPSGTVGATTRFKTAKVQVAVTDGYLTINADGGINTKINSANIVPVATSNYIYWSANAYDVAIEQGTTSTSKTFSLDLSNSRNRTDIQYALSAVYSSGGSNWLTYDASHASSEPNVTFNYSAAKNLPVGTHTATVTATASGYTSGKVVIRVKVTAPESSRPYVISSSPKNGAENVSVNTASVAANNLYVPAVEGVKGGVDNSTITNSTVKLLKVMGTITTEIMGVVQGTGGGDAISFSPSFALEPKTVYKFVITDGVKSHSGASFIPYTATFTTGEVITDGQTSMNVEFTPVPIPGTQQKKYSSLTFGPDGKLYALRLNGIVERFTVNSADGMLSNQQEIKTLVNKYGNRTAVGLAFDPASTATNLILWISHSSAGLEYAPEFDGNISRLSGPDLVNEQLVVTKLPRSSKDHMANSLVFGPDGALYLSQGSNGSMGDYDGTWQRIESLLSGAALRLDLQKLKAVTLPLDVRTTTNLTVINQAPSVSMRMSDNTYNPYGSESPLTIYASGIRNAYDLVWHTNGQLYVPANGSAAGGNTPASVAGTRRSNGTFYNGPIVPATTSVQVQNDWLFRVNPLKNVGFYGHPNPFRGEYVANRGYIDNVKLPSNMGPDVNYRGSAYNFEMNKSPNGAIEYKSDNFAGALKGKLLVCRFSGGGDIMVLEPGSMVKSSQVTSASSNDQIYDIARATPGAGTEGLVGMSGFANPLDLIEDVKTGNLYVIEFNWNNSSTRTAQITLLRASEQASLDGIASVYPMMISTSEVVGTPETKTKNYAVTVVNTGKGNLKIEGLDLIGTDAGQFKLKGIEGYETEETSLNSLSILSAKGAKAPKAPKKNKKAKAIKIRKNSSITFNVAFNPSSKGVKKAKIQVKSSKNPLKEVELVGLATVYEEYESAAKTVDSLDNATIEVTTLSRKAAKTPERKETNGLVRAMQVYPNPSSGQRVQVTLTNFGKQEKVQVTMHDVSGRTVRAVQLVTDENGGATADLKLEPFSARGLYIIKAQAPSGGEQSKLVIE